MAPSAVPRRSWWDTFLSRGGGTLSDCRGFRLRIETNCLKNLQKKCCELRELRTCEQKTQNTSIIPLPNTIGEETYVGTLVDVSSSAMATLMCAVAIEGLSTVLHHVDPRVCQCELFEVRARHGLLHLGPKPWSKDHAVSPNRPLPC